VSRLRTAGQAVLGGLALLVLLEGALRLTLGPPASALRVYSIVAPDQSWFEEVDGRVSAPFQVSPQEPPFAAKATAPRVAVIGGSVVHGGSGNLPLDREFPAVLERLTGIETLNLGSPGLDSNDHARQVDELLAWPVSLVVLLAGHNDFGNMYFQQRYAGASAVALSKTRSFLQNFQFYCLLQRLGPIQGVRPKVGGGELAKGPVVTEAQKAMALEQMVMNLRHIAWASRRAGVPLMLVVPVSSLLPPPVAGDCDVPPCARTLWERGMQARSSDPVEAARLLRQARDADGGPLRAPGAAERRIRTLAEEEGVLLADPEPELPHEGTLDIAAQALFQDHVHFTQRGHEELARALAPHVTAAVGR
jgi:lysophospholipase L1-like esterase